MDRPAVEIRLGRQVTVWHTAECGSPESAHLASVKSQGLLVLLALAPDGTRSRKWVQSILWSDRSDQQASGSLRQEVRNLLLKIPALSDALDSSRTSLSLDLEKVSICEEDWSAADSPEFLEELVMRDPAFMNWLAEQRQKRRPIQFSAAAYGVRPEDLPRRQICFEGGADIQSQTSFLESTLVHFLSRGLRESLHVDVIDSAFARNRDDVTWIEVNSAMKGEETAVVRVLVRDGPRKVLIWSDIGELPADKILEVGHPEFLAFCNRIVRGVLDELCLRGDSERGVGEAAMMGHLSIKKLFSMRPDEMLEADRLFDEANQRTPHGVYLAWRAILRSFQRIERHEGFDAQQLAEETIALSRAAMEQEPNNSLVLALASNALVALGQDVRQCKEIAMRSVELNPANPFAWDSLSIVGLYAQDLKRANDLAFKAARISRGAHHSFWWGTGVAVSASSLGQVEQAIAYAETAHAQAPDFRPPLRYLTGLYAYAGREEDAVRAASALKQLEPDFTIDRMIADPQYPISMLRLGGLLDQARLKAIV